MNEVRKVLFVMNRGSGRKKKPDRRPVIEAFTRQKGIAAEFFIMPKKGCMEQLRAALGKTSPDTVVAVGGDGTVSLVASILLGSRVRMGIVPAGSANGMARELDIPEDTDAALDIIWKAKTIACDLVQVNGNAICMHLSDIGLNARMVKYFEEGPLRGFPGYAIALVKAIRRKTKLNAVIQTPGGVKTTEAIMVLFANASKYGTGATINHKGSLTDGLFEVVIVKKIGPAEVWKMFFSTRGFNPKHIELHQASSVQVNTLKPVHLQVDGEYLGKVKAVEAKMLRDKLEVLVP